MHTMTTKTQRLVKFGRSISDLSLRMRMPKDNLKDKSLADLIRFCGSSQLYLPADYSPKVLLLPTCFRATAQFLIQHGMSSTDQTKTWTDFRLSGNN